MSDSTSAPISSSAAEENQVPASNERDPQAPVTEVPKARKKCLVLSLIRHGEVCSLLSVIANPIGFFKA